MTIKYLSQKEIRFILNLSKQGFDVIMICPKEEKEYRSIVEHYINLNLKKCKYRSISYIFKIKDIGNFYIYDSQPKPVFIKTRYWWENWEEYEIEAIDGYLSAFNLI